MILFPTLIITNDPHDHHVYEQSEHLYARQTQKLYMQLRHVVEMITGYMLQCRYGRIVLASSSHEA